MKVQEVKLNVAQAAAVSSAFRIPSWAKTCMVLIPDIDVGAVGLEMSMNAGSNYYPVLDPADGADGVVVASGSDPGWCDFSEWVGGVPDLPNILLRFTCAAQNTITVDFYVFMTG